MGRRIAVAFFGVAVAVLGTVAPGTSVAATCPNEAFRTGPSAQLAECRAYEQVTPVDKESGEGIYAGQGSTGAYASPSGDGVYFHSLSAYAGSQGNEFTNPFISTRLADTWDTEGISGPQANPSGILLADAYGVSEDLDYAIVGSLEAFAPGAIPGGSNLYLRDNRTGTYTLIMALADDSYFHNWASITGGNNPFVAGTSDFGDLLIPGPEGLYEFRGGKLELVVPGGRRVAETELVPGQISADGSRFFYATEGAVIYEYRRGQEPLRVSEDEEGNAIVGARFVGATADGEVAYFKNGYEGSVYRFEASAAPGDRVKAINPPVGLEGNPAAVTEATVGKDGTHVYFSAQNRFTADAEPIAPTTFGAAGYNLYVWHGNPGEAGEIRYLAHSETEYERAPTISSISPNGLYYAVDSNGALTPDAVKGTAANCPGYQPVAEAPGHCQNVFVYSYAADRIACASCDGAPPVGDSTLGGAAARAFSIQVPRALLDDGTALFDSPDALSPRDVNGAIDVYSWREGARQLVSGGTNAGPSIFVEATPSGSDVYFQTQQSLVGQDIDSTPDLYDARIGGGLPQAGVAAAPPCTGESSCRGGTVSASSTGTPATGTVRGARNVAGACLAVQGRARAARKRAHAFSARAKAADGRRAKSLRKKAAREAKVAGRLGRRARDCKGGA